MKAEKTPADTLVVEYLDVLNTALMAMRRSSSFQHILNQLQDRFSEGTVVFEIYGKDPKRIESKAPVRLEDGMLQPSGGSARKPAVRVKLKRSVIEDVVRDRQDHIRNPETLDWDWVRVSGDAGQEGRSSMETSRNGKALVDGMNEAFNREITTLIRYMLQGSIIQGLENEPLRQAYRAEIADELRHAQYLADKIVMLGGVPQLHAQVELPPSSVDEMMERDLAAEEYDVRQYRSLAQMADQAGDVELKLQMEEQAADETRHAEQLRRLRGLVPAA